MLTEMTSSVRAACPPESATTEYRNTAEIGADTASCGKIMYLWQFAWY